MDYQDISRQLGDALLKTPQYERLQAAKRDLEQDVPAQILLQAMEEMKEEMMERRENGEELAREFLDKARQLNERMAENGALKDYNQALESFKEILTAVNDTLAKKTGVPLAQGCGGCPKKRA